MVYDAATVVKSLCPCQGSVWLLFLYICVFDTTVSLQGNNNLR